MTQAAGIEDQMPEFVSPDTDPMDELRRWLTEATAEGVSNPAAMVLATVSPDGSPSARALMAGTRDQDSITFFTHYASPKGRDLAANPDAEGVFLWTPLERQVRVRGTITKTSVEVSDAYWASRPKNTQLAIHVGEQSSMVSDHDALVDTKAEIEARIGDGDVPRPDTYGGYRLTPGSYEFWQGRPSDRLHLRAIYTRNSEGSWDFGVMAP
ncbi:MAG: pyridoxamine 5'-phosphate oxidase [Chloroflexi bacterium]|nr:pyridoxamine 5'-phosphate oxidase [Chloroflexota bacterium]